MKKLVAIFALILTSIVPANAEDLSYINRYISWQDSDVIGDNAVLYSIKFVDGKGTGSPCNFGWTTDCNPNSGSFEVKNFLPLCDSDSGRDSRLDCLLDVTTVVDGKEIPGEFVPNQISVWDQYKFNAIPEKRIAPATAFAIYRFPGLKHSKGEFFAVKALLSFFMKDGIPENPEFNFLIAPAYQDTALNCTNLKTPDGYCWKTGSFTNNTDFKLRVKFAKKPSAWFVGRATDPIIEIKESSDKRYEVTFSGLSQSIPEINRNYYYVKESQNAEWTQISKKLPWLSWEVLSPNGQRMSMGMPFTSEAIQQYLDVVSISPSFNDADSLSNIWRIDSRKYGLDSKAPDCIQTNFVGVVTSNSMTYENSVPSWDTRNNSLVYSVASPHTALGKEFQGRYDLLISEQAAKCLWGLTNLKPVAEISVTGASGEKKAFTASSKISNGFYKFTAAGFTFSANTISVKMLSEGVTPITDVSMNPKPVEISAPVGVKKSTITCVKGKEQKKVTAIKPKCPTGYKKK